MEQETFPSLTVDINSPTPYVHRCNSGGALLMIFTLVLEIVAQKKKYLKLAFHSEQETGSVPHQASNERVHALEHTSKSNACKPEVPSQMELPLVEFLPHMEESINIANYLGQEQAFSNCNDLPSSMLPEDAELLFNSSCHTLTDLTNANDNDSYSFYI